MTIGVIPGRLNDSVDVSGGTGFRTAGRREVLTTPVGCWPFTSERPTPPAMTAVPSVPALAIRNRRRVHSGLVDVAAARAEPAFRGCLRREPERAMAAWAAAACRAGAFDAG